MQQVDKIDSLLKIEHDSYFEGEAKKKKKLSILLETHQGGCNG